MGKRVILFLCGLLSSCLVLEGVQVKKARGAKNGLMVNSIAGLSLGEGRIFADNPIVVTDNYKLSEDYDMNRVVFEKEKIIPISKSSFLEMDCEIQTTTLSSIEECFKNYDNKQAPPLVNNDKLWAYDANTTDFLQVNTFGHSKILLEKWLETLGFLYENMAYDGSQASYPTSVPRNLLNNRGFWFEPSRQTLVSYSLCDTKDNAYYDAARNELCYGYDSTTKNVYFAQDPTVIYHEVGHALQKSMLNMRNASAGTTLRTDLGVVFYDEAGGIGEGVSDYFSYFVNKRTHFAEWALGRFLNLSRPLTEEDYLHAPGISSAKSERPSYPDYLPYEPNRVHLLFEDVHNAGLIISHYLVALTRDIKESCSWSEDHSARYVMSILAETYAEMGDLTTRGSDVHPVGTVNHDPLNAWEWIHVVNPINYRKFAQTLAKKIYVTLSDGQGLQNRTRLPFSCGNGLVYPKDKIEELLDIYGLLLFDTYNLDGDSISQGHSGRHTNTLPETNPVINPYNRKRTVMVKKKYLIFNPEKEAPRAFVFDKRDNMRELVQNLIANGSLQISDKISSDLPYNNGNGRISPGEVIGVALNIYNNSNTAMGGVQILGNDWDHVKNQSQTISGQQVTRGFPCNNLGDGFPAGLNEGAADLSTGEGVQGGCDYITRYNGKNSTSEPNEELAPICFVQTDASSSTVWVQQDQYLKELDAFDRNQCLGEGLKDCLVRVAQGGEQSWIGQIPPRSSWSDNLFNSETNRTNFKSNHLIYLEVNPTLIIPETKFLCRFRARFTNCEDCFHDSRHPPSSSFDLFDDFLSYEYSGGRPFQVLNFQFTVGD